MDKFKSFLINESKSYLGRKVSNVLTALQELQEDMVNMGARHLLRAAEQIVNELRKILHGNWELQHHGHLKEIQRVAVAIQRTIENKGDLKEVIPAAAQALQELSTKLGAKVNNLKAPEMTPGEPVSQADFQETPPPQSQQQPQMNYSA
jgi:uncharacterized lipoprotein YmbA